MIEIIQNTDPEFSNTPRSGWQDGKFYLISGGRGIKRVYSAQCEDLPKFAAERPGCPLDIREKYLAQRQAEKEKEDKSEAKLDKKYIAMAQGHDFERGQFYAGEYICKVCHAPERSHLDIGKEE